MEYKRSYFGIRFFIIYWNLICHANNAFSFHMHHIQWAEDSISVYFAHSKTDSLGSQQKYVRCVYTNPLQPEICPILLLGIYWLWNNLDSNEMLFMFICWKKKQVSSKYIQKQINHKINRIYVPSVDKVESIFQVTIFFLIETYIISHQEWFFCWIW